MKADPVVDVLAAPLSIFILIVILLAFGAQSDLSAQVDAQVENTLDEARTHQVGLAFLKDETSEELEHYSRVELLALYYSLSDRDKITRDKRGADEQVEICRNCDDADIILEDYFSDGLNDLNNMAIGNWDVDADVYIPYIREQELDMRAAGFPVASAVDGPSVEVVKTGFDGIEANSDTTRSPEWLIEND